MAALEHERQGGGAAYQAQGFVHTPSDGQAVDRNLLDDAFGVDDEQPTEGYTEILNENAVTGRDVLQRKPPVSQRSAARRSKRWQTTTEVTFVVSAMMGIFR